MTEDEVTTLNECLAEEGHPPVARVWIICGKCRGEGTLAGYSGDAYTQADREEMGEDEWHEMWEYRRNCEDCRGAGKVLDISPEDIQRKEVVAILTEWWEMEAIERQERMMGA